MSLQTNPNHTYLRARLTCMWLWCTLNIELKPTRVILSSEPTPMLMVESFDWARGRNWAYLTKTPVRGTNIANEIASDTRSVIISPTPNMMAVREGEVRTLVSCKWCIRMCRCAARHNRQNRRIVGHVPQARDYISPHQWKSTLNRNLHLAEATTIHFSNILLFWNIPRATCLLFHVLWPCSSFCLIMSFLVCMGNGVLFTFANFSVLSEPLSQSKFVQMLLKDQYSINFQCSSNSKMQRPQGVRWN